MSPATAVWLLSALATVPTTDNVRSSVNRALPLLLKGAEGHVAKQTCFACHNQALPMLAFHAARERGFAVDDADLKQQTDFIAEFLGKNKEKFRQGTGTGGQVDTAGYALLTLELGGHKPDETTAAVVEYLLKHQADRDHYRVTSNRPPSEASSFTTNYLAVRGLRMWGTAERADAIAKRVEAVRGWLLKTPAKNTEDRVFRLLALKEAGAKDDAIQEAAQALLKTQRADGSWGQLDDLPGDAYATGSALFALNQAGGLAVTDTAYRKGVWFLLRTQAADGSWLLKSRSKPFQPYYESGFPYGKDQFISATASGWAAAALALACPPNRVAGR
jgi:Prenyltransferase and squalene oxidase repeat